MNRRARRVNVRTAERASVFLGCSSHSTRRHLVQTFVSLLRHRGMISAPRICEKRAEREGGRGAVI